MVDKIDLERQVLEIPIKRLTSLRKDIAKYEEQVNKCDISETNVLVKSIGADVDYLRYTEIRTTEEQKQELKLLENTFTNHMDNLKRCRCVRKIEK
jgi:hypothetical protein